MRRWLKRCAYLICIVAALMVLATGLLLARLAMKPLSLELFAGSLSQYTDDLMPGIGFDFAKISLYWDRSTNRLEIVLNDVALDMDGAADKTGLKEEFKGNGARLPRVYLVLQAKALLKRQVRLTQIVITRPDVRVRWSAKAIEALLEGPSGNSTLDLELDAPGLLTEIINALLAPDALASTFSTLDHVAVDGAHVTLVEDASGTTWLMPETQLQFRRAQAQALHVSGRGTLMTQGDSQAGQLDFDATVFGQKGRRQLDVKLSDLRLPLLVDGLDILPVLAGIDMPLDGDMRIDLSAKPDRSLVFLLDAHAKKGQVTLAPWYPDPRPFDEISTSVLFDSTQRALEITGLSARFADTEMFVSGTIIPQQDRLSFIALKGGFSALGVDDLSHYWPRTVSNGGREWIERNLESGRISNGELTFLHDEEAHADEKDGLQLDFQFDQLVAHVLRPMPPILGAKGRGHLTDRGLTLHIEGGEADGLPVAGSQVVLSGFGKSEPTAADIQLKMSGALPQILRLIDYEPLGYTTAFGLDPDSLSGRGDLVAYLTFPLVKSLSLNDVGIAIDATVNDLMLPDIFAATPLTEGQLALKIDREGLQASGTGTLGPASLHIDWDERFSPPPGDLSSRFDISTVLTSESLKALLFDPDPYLEGPVPASIQLLGRGPDIQRGHIDLALDKARLSLALMDWEKLPDNKATMGFDLDLSQDGKVLINQMKIQAANDHLFGAMQFDEEGVFQSARFDEIVLGENRLSADLKAQNGGFDARIKGPVFDLRPALSTLGEKLEASGAPAMDGRPSIAFTADFESVLSLSDITFSNVRIDARHTGMNWAKFHLDAELGADDAVKLRLDSAGEGKERSFGLEAQNAGHVLAGMGLFDNAEGGAFTLDATLTAAGTPLAATGRADLRDFRIVRGETSDVTIEEGAASQLDQYIGKNGLLFNQMRVPFTLSNGIVDIEGARASGPSLGLTLEGQIDEKLERVNMNGIIVPAYRLNALLGNIPLLGGLFTGGKGGGMFALSYRIKGKVADPTISVNALTAIIPGILRKPFEGSKGTLDKVEPDEEEPSPEPDSESDEGLDADSEEPPLFH
ncbi:hypothetical protein JCM17845_17640 [Iodidimonas gelatinilytica]|uniref:YhdP central domain-containing protein n=1 Tax=Iodidimonas gelatinilytica TaxID=1236966 RepID=A0A5A7MYJ2_9PROT|nr:AsmA-like C-terminal region-containing protein [Iodidimonas gelatinilytica]GER01141.1 hypothetical protein JCM17845_17640 [Iodidimonas gelatinilytica]